MIFRSYCCNPRTTFTAGSLKICINLPGNTSIVAILPLPARWPTPAAGGEAEGRGRVPERHQQARPVPPVCAAWPEKEPAAPSTERRGGRPPEHGCRRRRPKLQGGGDRVVLLRAKGGARGLSNRETGRRSKDGGDGQGRAVAQGNSTAAPFFWQGDGFDDDANETAPLALRPRGPAGHLA
jgi:hypothetical protein